MKSIRIAFLFFSLLLAGKAAAQSPIWQGTYNTNGYTCFSLGPIVDNRHTVLAAKGTDAGGYATLNVKFRTPYRWTDTSTACVKIIRIDLTTGNRYSQDVFCDYRNGWVYLSHYLSHEGQPCYSYIVTLYEHNDFGQSSGKSRTIDLHLDKLDAARIPFSDKAFETHW